MTKIAEIKLYKATPQQLRFACLNFHYAKAVPTTQISFSCFENDQFIGVIAYGGGANNNSAKSFGLATGQILELVRVALNGKQTVPTSKFVATSMKLVRKHKPLVKLLVSYADITNQGHKGIIYRATNWIYLGQRHTNKGAYYKINGKIVHGRSARAKYGHVSKFPAGWEHVDSMSKHLYAYPFDKDLRRELESKAVSYHETEGGAVPTSAHQDTGEK